MTHLFEVHRRRPVKWLALCLPFQHLPTSSIFPLSSFLFFTPNTCLPALFFWIIFWIFAWSAPFFDTALGFLVPCLSLLLSASSFISWICVPLLLFRFSVSHSFQASSVFFLVFLVFPLSTSVPQTPYNPALQGLFHQDLIPGHLALLQFSLGLGLDDGWSSQSTKKGEAEKRKSTEIENLTKVDN